MDSTTANYVKQVLKAVVDQFVAEGLMTAQKATNIKGVIDQA